MFFFILMTARLQAPDFPYMRHFQSSIPFFGKNMCAEALPLNSEFRLRYEGINSKNSSGDNFEKERATALKMFREYHKWLKTTSPLAKLKTRKNNEKIHVSPPASLSVNVRGGTGTEKKYVHLSLFFFFRHK